MKFETIPEKDSKKEGYLELFGGEPDAIFAWSGDIIKRKWKGGKKSDFRSTAYSDKDAFGYLAGGKGRIVAAAKAAEQFPQAKIVATSRSKEEMPFTHAQVIARELEHRHITGDRIILEEKSVSTATQLREMFVLAAKNGWKRIAIITSYYHIPRAERMYDKIKGREEFLRMHEDDELQEALDRLEGADIRFISDKQVLAGLEGGHWKRFYDQIKQELGPELEARERLEEQGCRDLDNGTYGIKK